MAGLAQTALNLLVAVTLGVAVGVERRRRQRLAGLRTNALVAPAPPARRASRPRSCPASASWARA